MGQKVHPYSFRLGITNTWKSRWFSDKKYKEQFVQDVKLRRYLEEKLKDAGVARIEIERSQGMVRVIIHTSKPGIIIGRSGAAIDKLNEELARKFQGKTEIKVIEIRRPELESSIVAQNIAQAIENRVSYRRAAKSAIQRCMEIGAVGIKIRVSGRLNGAEIARSESFKDGNIPLHTLRADIDYTHYNAHTTFGVIGIKVWICKGYVFTPGEAGAIEEVERIVEQDVEDKPLPKRRRPHNRKNSGKKLDE